MSKPAAVARFEKKQKSLHSVEILETKVVSVHFVFLVNLITICHFLMQRKVEINEETVVVRVMRCRRKNLRRFQSNARVRQAAAAWTRVTIVTIVIETTSVRS